MSKLLPCPFCGGEARIENNDRTIYDPKTLGVVDVEYGEPPCFWVKCEDCEAFVGGFDTEVDAIAAWNRRADNAQLAEAQASVTQLGIALVQEREKSAEAQADNAGIVGKLKKYMREVYDYDMDSEDALPSGAEGKYCEGIFEAIEIIEDCKNAHPGAPLLAELEQYKRALELACESLYEFYDMSDSDEVYRENCETLGDVFKSIAKGFLELAKAGGE